MAEAASAQIRYVEKTNRELVALARLLSCLISPTSNILDSIEDLKRFFPRLQVSIVNDDLWAWPEIEARAYPKRWLIRIRRSIYEGLLRGQSRGRWTLLHELAHVLLQHPGRPPRDLSAVENKRTLSGRREREADILTRSFFMPFDSMADLSSEEIRKRVQVSTRSIERRIAEFEKAKAIRASAQRRGLDVRRVTSEFGHRKDIECQFTIVAQALCDTLRTYHLAGLTPLQPISNNLFSTAVLVAAASGLLFDAYSSLRRNRDYSLYTAPAVLALSILAICPLRPTQLQDREGALRANLRCASRAALKCAGLPAIELDSVPYLHPQHKPIPYESHFLLDIRLLGQRVIANPSVVLTLENFPIYEMYNEGHDIRWEDVHEIEYLAAYFQVLERAREE